MSGDLKCGWEPLESVAADPAIHDLLDEQWREFKPLPGSRPAPNWRSVFMLERAGEYRVWTARNPELVGFIQFQFVVPGGHAGARYAVDVGWWLSGENKSIWQGLTLWRTALSALRGMDVTIVRGHEHSSKPLGAFFARLGMKPATIVYERAL